MATRVSLSSQLSEDKDEYKLDQRKKSRANQDILVDRISGLPYEILVSIVSLLSLKEAASTSILSRRWQNLWKYTINLNFQVVDFKVGDHFRSFKDQNHSISNQRSRKYVDWVDRVLEQYRGQNIERFRVFFFLNKSFTSSINKWIEFAMKKSVQILEFHFLEKQYLYTGDNYTFPQELLGLGGGNTLKRMHSGIPSVHHCFPFNSVFKCLKHLCFQQVDVTGEVLEHFLSNCPVLETLMVLVARNLVNLRVVGPSIALKHLVIKCCPDIKSIEICNVNIVSFVYKGIWMDLHLSNVPLLVEIDIFRQEDLHIYEFTSLAFTQIACCLPQIKVLKLDLFGAVYNQSYEIPILANVKHLELVIEADYHWSLHQLTSFMKAAPYMHKLVLKLRFRTSQKLRKEAAEFPHCFLKVVEVVGYRPFMCAVDHVEYLMKNVVSLEKIIIDPVRRWIWPIGMDRGRIDLDWEAMARGHAERHLKRKIPSGVEFVCL